MCIHSNMISNRSLGCDLNDVAPRKRLRSNITNLLLSNTVSGARRLPFSAVQTQLVLLVSVTCRIWAEHTTRTETCWQSASDAVCGPGPVILRAKSRTRTAERKTPQQPCQYFYHTKCRSPSASALRREQITGQGGHS